MTAFWIAAAYFACALGGAVLGLWFGFRVGYQEGMEDAEFLRSHESGHYRERRS